MNQSIKQLVKQSIISKFYLFFCLMLLALLSCSDAGTATSAVNTGGSDTGGGAPTLYNGYIIDSAVEGLVYACNNATDNSSGKTDAKGLFRYPAAATCSLSIGKSAIGSLRPERAPNSIYTPYDIWGNNARRAAAFLQTLDGEGSLSDGIQIPDSLADMLVSQTIDFSKPLDSAADNPGVGEILAVISKTTNDLVPEANAVSHLDASILTAAYDLIHVSSNTKGDLYLPPELKFGDVTVSITWTSSAPDCISVQGIASEEGDCSTDITGVFRSGGKTDTKTWTVNSVAVKGSDLGALGTLTFRQADNPALTSDISFDVDLSTDTGRHLVFHIPQTAAQLPDMTLKGSFAGTSYPNIAVGLDYSQKQPVVFAKDGVTKLVYLNGFRTPTASESSTQDPDTAWLDFDVTVDTIEPLDEGKPLYATPAIADTNSPARLKAMAEGLKVRGAFMLYPGFVTGVTASDVLNNPGSQLRFLRSGTNEHLFFGHASLSRAGDLSQDLTPLKPETNYTLYMAYKFINGIRLFELASAATDPFSTHHHLNFYGKSITLAPDRPFVLTVFFDNFSSSTRRQLNWGSEIVIIGSSIAQGINVIDEIRLENYQGSTSALWGVSFSKLPKQDRSSYGITLVYGFGTSPGMRAYLDQ